ncbi:holo-ACP synthase [Buchnera aphidicola]|uniref:holo-ACP synthase n=1 Tax=Buchnera aphidicola TaxID=9 RepID=UPI003464498A
MSIIGVGIDIIKISRLKNIVKKFGKKFIKRILSKKEFQEFSNNPKDISFLAKRFAAKEAASKSLGIGIQNNIQLNHFEVYHDHLGKPKINFLKQAKIFLKKLNIKSIHISITDEKKYACAVIIIESK